MTAGYLCDDVAGTLTEDNDDDDDDDDDGDDGDDDNDEDSRLYVHAATAC